MYNGDLVKAAFYLGDNNDKVEKYAFTISSGDEHGCVIFKSVVDWDDNGRLEVNLRYMYLTNWKTPRYGAFGYFL